MIYVLHSAAWEGRKIFIKGKRFMLWFWVVVFLTFSASHWQPLYILKLYAVCYVCRDIYIKTHIFYIKEQMLSLKKTKKKIWS